MDIVKELDQLETSYYGEWEEEKAPVIEAMLKLHLDIKENHPDSFNRFVVQASERFGGTYIPYLFWDKLASFIKVDQDDRHYLHALIKAFANSIFDDVEQRKMKSLLVPYLAQEKKFELNKISTLIIEKSHPTVKEYFVKLMNFVDHNQKSTQMYCDKFNMVIDSPPNFDLLGLPITQLRDRVG